MKDSHAVRRGSPGVNLLQEVTAISSALNWTDGMGMRLAGDRVTHRKAANFGR